MLDISLDINESHVWKEFKREIAARSFSHALAFRCLESNYFEVVIKIGKLLLGNNGWMEDRHPDLLYAGETSMKNNKPPTIDECREFMSYLCLLPVVSNKRLGVIMFADQLMLGAANSLLKITEEPPSHVHLLFMMQNDTLLPTLRSRVRYISILTDSFTESDIIPGNDALWFEWVKSVKETADIVSSLEKWGSYAIQNENFELAFKIESIRLFLDTGKLSKPIALDLVLLALKEGLAVEHSFGNFW